MIGVDAMRLPPKISQLASDLLRTVINNASVVQVDGVPTHLLIEVPPELADALAEFGASNEDLEDGGDLEDSDDLLPPDMTLQLTLWSRPPYS